MKLSKLALKKLEDRKLMLTLALALDFSEQWTRRLIEANKNNGPLTTVKSLDTLKKETGLSDTQILVEEKKKPAVEGVKLLP